MPGVDPPLLWAELKATYQAELDAASEPLREDAKVAHERCVAAAAELQTDAWLAPCQRWREREYPGSSSRVLELAPRGLRLGTAGAAAPITSE